MKFFLWHENEEMFIDDDGYFCDEDDAEHAVTGYPIFTVQTYLDGERSDDTTHLIIYAARYNWDTFEWTADWDIPLWDGSTQSLKELQELVVDILYSEPEHNVQRDSNSTRKLFGFGYATSSSSANYVYSIT